MSQDIKGGINYALVKRHYDADDYVNITVTATEDYYVVGTMACLADPTVADAKYGWTPFTHGQSVAPTSLPAGTSWPTEVDAFEAKDLLFYSDQNCWIRFGGSRRVQHYIPANTYMRFRRRCFIFFVVRDTVSGTLRCWITG